MNNSDISRTIIYGRNGSVFSPFQIDNNGNISVVNIISAGDSFNNATPNGNQQRTQFGPGSRSTSFNGGRIVNVNARGLHLVTNVTAVPGGDTITPVIQGWDETADIYYDILVGAPISTIGINVIKVYPGLQPSPNAIANDILPYEWRVQMIHSGAGSFTYSMASNTVV